MTQSSNRIVLTYLNTGGRAEATRLAFTVGGVPFEDRRITPEQFAANQTDHSRFPTEQLPVLEVGSQKFTQAMAILRFAGKLAGLYPFDPREALAIDEALDHVFEVYKSEPSFNRTVSAQAQLQRSGSVGNSVENSPVNSGDQQKQPQQPTGSRKNSPIPPMLAPVSDLGSPTTNTATTTGGGEGMNEQHTSKLVNLGEYSNANLSTGSNSALVNNNNNNNNNANAGPSSGGAAVINSPSSQPASPFGSLRKTNSMLNPQHQTVFGGSFDAEACLSQIKLCFRRVCELINYDVYGSPYVASPRPSIADFAVFALVRQIQRGMIPHVPPTLLEANEFAPLYQLVDILEDYPGVRFFYEQRF